MPTFAPRQRPTRSAAIWCSRPSRDSRRRHPFAPGRLLRVPPHRGPAILRRDGGPLCRSRRDGPLRKRVWALRRRPCAALLRHRPCKPDGRATPLRSSSKGLPVTANKLETFTLPLTIAGTAVEISGMFRDGTGSRWCSCTGSGPPRRTTRTSSGSQNSPTGPSWRTTPPGCGATTCSTSTPFRFRSWCRRGTGITPVQEHRPVPPRGALDGRADRAAAGRPATRHGWPVSSTSRETWPRKTAS